uniref:Uncharacterized protein n=1 Tax=Rhizophora mucronata TaxID=61149 RepID=A0A2P2NN94_RHIMU
MIFHHKDRIRRRKKIKIFITQICILQ